MNKLNVLALSFVLAACTKDPNVAVRIDCGDYNDKGLQATLNAQPVGDCPVDILVHAGEVNVSARKDNEDASYLFAEAKMTLAENAMKRIKLDIQPVFTEEYYYRKATDSAGMQAYLEKQPDGKRRSEITDKLEQYYFDQATDIVGMQAYLEKQPDGKRRSEVSDMIEQYYFDKATDIDGTQSYLQQLPQGKRRSEVEKRLKVELTKRQARLAPNLSMLAIPAGSFMMGCSKGDSVCFDDEKPIRKVSVPAFKLSQTEVTFAQYDIFAQSTGRKLPDDRRGWGRGNRPVISVSWYDAVAYTQWLSQQTGEKFRLPTEAEWEYAARAGTTSKYSWGNEIGNNKANCGGCGSMWAGEQTAPVKSFQPNAFGLYDMHGNVQEWVQDCYHENYNGAPSNGSAWVTNCKGNTRVLRGGNWFSDAENIRTSSRRGDYIPEVILRFNGFRVAQDL